MKILIKNFLTLLFFLPATSFSQEFYINTYEFIPPMDFSNVIIRCDISNTSETIQPFCPPTQNAFDLYSDIAIDSNNNFYYVTSNGLLYQRNSNNSTCNFLGTFGGATNALVADNGNFIYAAGGNTLEKYDISSGTFTSMGQLPVGYASSGDLFFYEHNLFLTTGNGLLQIDMNNPSQSCLYMSLNGIVSMAAFSVQDENNSRAYIVNDSGLTLHEIDMTAKQVGSPIRSFPSMILGAAAPYPLTSTNATCTPILATQEIKTDTEYLTIINPAKNYIIFKTNINTNDVVSLKLFDNLGRLIHSFSNDDNLAKLDISSISEGNYLLVLTTKNGKSMTKKVMIRK